MGNPLFYLWMFYCSLTRLIARHMIIPPLRKLMFQSTGIVIGRKTFINLDVYFFDEFKQGLILIDDEVAVAPRVTFAAASHPNDSFIGREYNLNKLAKIHKATISRLGGDEFEWENDDEEENDVFLLSVDENNGNN